MNKNLLIYGLASIGISPLLAQKSDYPNVVFILADDMGIGDLGCYGGEKIKTPNIDKLAKDGVQFMHHYSGATVSAPSRCALLTGKHTGHTTIRGNKGMSTPTGYSDLPILENDVTVAEIFKQKGYATMCVGKWGLGGAKTSGSPINKGFDYFFGYLSQGAAHRYYPDFLYENEEKVYLNKEIYSHYLIMEKGLDFIKSNAQNPFFAYFAVTPPHADLDIPELGEYEDEFIETPYINDSGKGFKTQMKPKAAYAAMVSEVDKNVGQIISLLKEEGIYDNTIILFSSDNGVHKVGGHDPDFFNSNGSFRGYKRDLYEGGVRTPFIVSYPAKISPRFSFHISSFWDFLPTVCELLDLAQPNEIDGISYLPELFQTSIQRKHEFIYHEFHEQGGKQSLLRVADGWKLIRLQVNNADKKEEQLYNIFNDVSETDNVIVQYPKIADELRLTMDLQRTENPNFEFIK